MDTMGELRRLAAEQHGVLGRWQCRSVGAGAAFVRRLDRRGEWERLSPRVLRLVGSSPSAKSRLMAAVLDAGRDAVASHRAAAALWHLPGFHMRTLEVVRPHAVERQGPTLGTLHRSRSLPAHHVTTVDGIPVTTPARTIFDLAGLLPPARTERALDNAIAMSPGLLRALHRMLPELAERGRTGITLMRELLANRPMGYIAPASGLEARLIRVLDEAGIKSQRQVDVGGDDWIGRVDLLVVGTNVVVEADSARFHTSLLDRERDAHRDDALRAAGFHPVRVTEEDVWHAPDKVVRAVRSGRRNASPVTHSSSQNGGVGDQRPMPLAM